MPRLFRLTTATGRVSRKSSFWDGKRKQFAAAVISTFILLQLLFLGNLSYLYGSVFKSPSRAHNLNILMVDYDQGVIGESLRTAAKSLQAPNFPSVQESPSSEYPSSEDVYQAVYRGDYWAALYTDADASDRLSSAISGGPTAASYNATPALTYIFNEARYVTMADGTILSNIQTLLAVTRGTYLQMNGSAALSSLNSTNPASAAALFNPITSTARNIKPVTHGSRVFYNTVSMVMPIIMQFFFLMAINGISSAFSFYSHLPVATNGAIRISLSLSYTLIGALCMTGYIWAFRESWALSGAQFAVTWMVLWLYMHVNFVVMDTATAFIPMSFLPFFVLTWIITNVASTVFPFELSAGFFRVGYALPAHETWSLLMTVWSGGANNHVRIALPILFAWEILMLPAAMVGLHYRCGKAATEHRATEALLEEKAQAKVEEISAARGLSETERSAEVQEVEREEEAVQREATREEYFPSVPAPFEQTIERWAGAGRAV